MKSLIGFNEALALTASHIEASATEYCPLERLTGRVLADDIIARVDSPTVNVSLKDGYALISEDLRFAGKSRQVSLKLIGRSTAGRMPDVPVSRGTAVRITTGAPIPQGADAVLSEEFAASAEERVICYNTAEPGRNVLERGTDVRKGETVAQRYDRITPELTGLMATAGVDGAEVYRPPKVCVIATGDEVVAPGKPLPEGKLYASNITEICAWLRQYRIAFQVVFAADKKAETMRAIKEQMMEAEAFISSGGIWGSEKDIMLDVLETLGWKGIYHRVRMGPGKAVAFGVLENKPFFCLPGGPPSNEMAFLQIALPGILRMSGETVPPFPVMKARLLTGVSGDMAWTQFIHAEIRRESGVLCIKPLRQKSRLQTMAKKNALLVIPEGCDRLQEGDFVEAQVINSRVLRQPE